MSLPSQKEPAASEIPFDAAYNLSSVMSVRRKIMSDEAILARHNAKLDASDFDAVSAAIRKHIGGGATSQVIKASLMHRVKTRWTEAKAAEDAWLLAGNMPQLRAGIVVRPWSRQINPEWVPVQYVDEQPMRTSRNTIGSLMFVRVLAGSPVGKLFSTFYSNKFCRWFAEVSLGFSNARGKYQFQRNADIINLRCYVLLMPPISDETTMPRFAKYHVTSGMLDHNKVLIRIRNRDAAECPEGYNHHCYQCPLGYDACSWGTHPVTYEKITCGSCGNQGWADPRKRELKLCLNCYRIEQLSRR